MATNISVTFHGGLGSVSVKIFRNGVQLDQGSINKSGTIVLAPTITGDAISINGISPPNGTDITINVQTTPSTPDHSSSGPIFKDYDVL